MGWDTVLRALSTGGLSLIIKDYDKEDKMAYEPNWCKCCGNRTEMYGTCSIGHHRDEQGRLIQETSDDSREVCVLCLEGGCGCGGSNLAREALVVNERHSAVLPRW